MTRVRHFFLPFIWLLLAAALLLRAAIPTGWMPTADQDGVRIALCTGAGTEFLTLGSDGRLHKDALPPEAPREPCPFALAAAHAADMPPVIALPLAPARLEELPAASRAQAAATARRNLRPPARGPPTLA